MKKALWAAVAMDNLDGIREILNEGSSYLNDDQVLLDHFSGSALERCLYPSKTIETEVYFKVESYLAGRNGVFDLSIDESIRSGASWRC